MTSAALSTISSVGSIADTAAVATSCPHWRPLPVGAVICSGQIVVRYDCTALTVESATFMLCPPFRSKQPPGWPCPPAAQDRPDQGSSAIDRREGSTCSCRTLLDLGDFEGLPDNPAR